MRAIVIFALVILESEAFVGLEKITLEAIANSAGIVSSVQKSLDSIINLLRREICYKDLGCFSKAYPFTNTQTPLPLLPQSPDTIRTKFRLYTPENSKDFVELDARHLDQVNSSWPNFRLRQTQIFVHGFLDGPDRTSWTHQAKDKLLRAGDYNVIVTDWTGGNFIPYTQATANSRVVGAQIAQLILILGNKTGITPDLFHLIGHSLGAHIAGYAGERVPGLGRITGLDPAGPYFEGTDRPVRLDETDAVFVDIIHSDAKPLIQLGQGTRTQSGHSDFWPNLGINQPGCIPFEKHSQFTLENSRPLDILNDVFNCQHSRAFKYLVASIDFSCTFPAFPCSNAEDYTSGRCTTCGTSGCSNMGFYADKTRPAPGQRVNYYLTTTDTAPFCR